MPKKKNDGQPQNPSDETRPTKSLETLPEITQPQKRRKQTSAETKPMTPVVDESAGGLSDDKSEPLQKPRRRGWIWLGILGMVLIIIAGCIIGYWSAIHARQVEETNQRLVLAATQYELSLVDIKNNDLAMAKRRLDYVIQIYPEYPGAAEKLAFVMVSLAQANPSVTLVPSVATVDTVIDTGSLNKVYDQATGYFAAQDWANLLNAVLSLRNTDPTYKAIQVDGLYYIALRNMGIINISNGNLEKGLYDFSVAEQIGPIDQDAASYRQWARMYLNAASYYGVNWQAAMSGFYELYNMVPNMIDFNNVTVRERYARSIAGYGDYLQSTYDWCGAVTQYEASTGIMSLQYVIDGLPDAREKCANPPATPTPTLEPGVTPTATPKK